MGACRPWLPLLVLIAFVLPAVAQDKFAVELLGVGDKTITLTPESLKALPPVEMDVTFQTSKGISSGRYKGVLFWDVLKANGAFEGLEHSAELTATFTVLASDDYLIAFSIGEIHPDFGNTAMMLADQVDGKPLEGGYRIIVPGDTRGARNVRDVVKIELHRNEK